MTPEFELAFLREAVIDLQEYVLSKEIFWFLRTNVRVQGGRQVPQLTLGNLSLSQARVAASLLSVDQENELENISHRIQKVREEWLSNWQIKEESEFGVRMNLWQQYLRDLRNAPRQHAPFFSNEVRNRAILQLFLLEGLVKNVNVDQLKMLDLVLRGLSSPGPFLWEPQIVDGFARDQFWFLYIAINDRGADG